MRKGRNGFLFRSSRRVVSNSLAVMRASRSGFASARDDFPILYTQPPDDKSHRERSSGGPTNMTTRSFCDGLTRRDALRLGTAGLFGLGLTLPNLLELQAAAPP